MISSSFFIPRDEGKGYEIFKRVRIMPLYSFPHFKDFNPRITENENKYFIHLDFDAFYAQVEQRDNPNLRGRPVSVGGTPDGKGIVMTASYEARALGIDTGISVYQALKICPDLIPIPCYGPKYEDIMENIQNILLDFVPEEYIEKYSVDECFVDISPVVRNFKQAEFTASEIKKRIKKIEKLTCSIGCSYNKTYAKMATKFQKPDGLTLITKEDKAKIFKLPVTKMWGIGRRIERRLNAMNVITVGDLADCDEYRLRKEFGINGIVFKKMAGGNDTSGIFTKKIHEKCLHHNHTLTTPIYKTAEVMEEIRRIGEYMCRKLRSKALIAKRLYFVVRYDNLKYAGADAKMKQYTNDDRTIFEYAFNLFSSLPQPTQKHKARMFGMGVFELQNDIRRENIGLFDKKIYLPYYEIDKLKLKYGEAIIRVGIGK